VKKLGDPSARLRSGAAPNLGFCCTVGVHRPRLADSTCAGCSQPLSQSTLTLKSSPPVTMSFFKSVRGKAGRVMDRVRSRSQVQRGQPSPPQLLPLAPQDEPQSIMHQASEQTSYMDSTAASEQFAEAYLSVTAPSSAPVAMHVTAPSRPPSPAPSASLVATEFDLALEHPLIPSTVTPVSLGPLVRDDTLHRGPSLTLLPGDLQQQQ